VGGLTAFVMQTEPGEAEEYFLMAIPDVIGSVVVVVIEVVVGKFR